MPFNAAVATRFIKYYNTTIQFQSTLAYLRDPPEGYQQPAIDVLAGLQQIQHNIDDGKYKNQYAFEAEVQALVYSMHDMHADLSSGVLSAFSFASPRYIVSASVDGKSDPEIFLWGMSLNNEAVKYTNESADDIYKRLSGETYRLNPIATINGRDVVEYLTEFAALNSQGTLEPHADWNQLFTGPVQDIQGAFNTFSDAATFYPGDKLEFILANGTNITTRWLAVYNNAYDTGALSTGGDFYNYFVLGLLPQSYYDAIDESSSDSSDDDSTDDSSTDDTSTDDSSDDDSSSSGTGVTSWESRSYGAFPDPDISQSDLSLNGGGVLTGYFLNESSTAVLSIPSFVQYGDMIQDFDRTVGYFVKNASNANISHVIIDLQQNMGGLSFLAFVTFAWFFPQTEPFGGSRRRSHPLANSLGKFTTEFWSSLREGTDDYDSWYESLAADEWVVTDRLNADTSENFTSWEQYYGPRSFRNDNFSLTERYNLSSPVFAETASDGWYLDPDNWGQAYWSPQDIMLVRLHARE